MRCGGCCRLSVVLNLDGPRWAHRLTAGASEALRGLSHHGGLLSVQTQQSHRADVDALLTALTLLHIDGDHVHSRHLLSRTPRATGQAGPGRAPAPGCRPGSPSEIGRVPEGRHRVVEVIDVFVGEWDAR